MPQESLPDAGVGRESAPIDSPLVAPRVGELRASRETIRQTTKWLVAAAAAVGAMVVAGLKLTALPACCGALGLAIAGFVLALLGVGTILVQASNVLALGFSGVHELADLKLADTCRGEAGSDPRVAGGIKRSAFVEALDKEVPMITAMVATDISDLWGKLSRSQAQQRRLPVAPSSTSQSGEITSRAQLESDVALLASAASHVVDLANQRVTETEFKRLKAVLIWGGLLVVIGVTLFAAAPKLPGAAGAATVARPTPVLLAVSAPELFGKGCQARVLEGVALDGPWRAPTVVTLPTGECTSGRLVITPNIGYAIPAPDLQLCASVGNCVPSDGPSSWVPSTRLK